MPEFRERGIPAFLMALNGILGKIQKVYFLVRNIFWQKQPKMQIFS